MCCRSQMIVILIVHAHIFFLLLSAHVSKAFEDVKVAKRKCMSLDKTELVYATQKPTQAFENLNVLSVNYLHRC